MSMGTPEITASDTGENSPATPRSLPEIALEIMSLIFIIGTGILLLESWPALTETKLVWGKNSTAFWKLLVVIFYIAIFVYYLASFPFSRWQQSPRWRKFAGLDRPAPPSDLTIVTLTPERPVAVTPALSSRQKTTRERQQITMTRSNGLFFASLTLALLLLDDSHKGMGLVFVFWQCITIFPLLKKSILGDDPQNSRPRQTVNPQNLPQGSNWFRRIFSANHVATALVGIIIIGMAFCLAVFWADGIPGPFGHWRFDAALSEARANLTLLYALLPLWLGGSLLLQYFPRASQTPRQYGPPEPSTLRSLWQMVRGIGLTAIATCMLALTIGQSPAVTGLWFIPLAMTLLLLVMLVYRFLLTPAAES